MATAATRTDAPRYTILGQEVRLPVVVRDASSGAATYFASTNAVRRLLAGTGLEPAEVLPGRALVSLAGIEYRDNDLGRYLEISIAFFVRLARFARIRNWADFFRGKLPTYIHRLPVDGEFTCEAGRTIWGFPKTVEDLRMERTGDVVRFDWKREGRLVLGLRYRSGGRRTLPDAEMLTYSRIGGRLHRTRFRSGGEGVRFVPFGASYTLGTGPVAEELRSLGLSRRPFLGMWIERMHGSFDAPEPVA